MCLGGHGPIGGIVMAFATDSLHDGGGIAKTGKMGGDERRGDLRCSDFPARKKKIAKREALAQLRFF